MGSGPLCHQGYCVERTRVTCEEGALTSEHPWGGLDSPSLGEESPFHPDGGKETRRPLGPSRPEDLGTGPPKAAEMSSGPSGAEHPLGNIPASLLELVGQLGMFLLSKPQNQAWKVIFSGLERSFSRYVQF